MALSNEDFVIIERNFEDSDSKVVFAFNKALNFLKTQRIDQMPFCSDPPGTSREHYASIFCWLCNVYLRRALNLADQYARAVNESEVLIAALLGRALVETVAHFHALMNASEKYIESREFAKLYHLIASYLAYKKACTDSIRLKPLHVLDSLREVDRTYGVIQKSYDWLSEFAHPNSAGTAQSFSEIDKEKGVVVFVDKRNISKSPLLEPAIIFLILEEDWVRVACIAKRIESEVEPTAKVCDLFIAD